MQSDGVHHMGNPEVTYNGEDLNMTDAENGGRSEGTYHQNTAEIRMGTANQGNLEVLNQSLG